MRYIALWITHGHSLKEIPISTMLIKLWSKINTLQIVDTVPLYEKINKPKNKNKSFKINILAYLSYKPIFYQADYILIKKVFKFQAKIDQARNSLGSYHISLESQNNNIEEKIIYSHKPLEKYFKAFPG
jgi:hypothetical protein